MPSGPGQIASCSDCDASPVSCGARAWLGLHGIARDQISERTHDALDRVARDGRARSRLIPYGFRTARGGTRSVKGDRAPLVKHDGEQKILATMRRLRKNERGFQAVADHLNSRGHRTRSGKLWNRKNLWAILDAHEAREEARAEPQG